MTHGDKHTGRDKPTRHAPATRQPRPRYQHDDDLDDALLDRYGRAAFCRELRQPRRRRG